MVERNLKRIDKGSQYYIDENTGTVINKSIKEYEEYKMKVEQAKELETLKSEVGSIKSDLSEIKLLLQKAFG